MSDQTTKPSWGEVSGDLEWQWMGDVPGVISTTYSDEETKRVSSWQRSFDARYGAENATTGRPRNPSPTCHFAVYVRKSALGDDPPPVTTPSETVMRLRGALEEIADVCEKVDDFYPGDPAKDILAIVGEAIGTDGER